eukprot:CAMPEP_0174268106 /NCGR_PEP_ID=MMETSP0439-20130205/36142_1 /TAXON_ID=0 /ORGANISM="Stereomyxa ramosa, Strain Chinc5" /LENGTH=804 /DNA_ID=CAMNT_0015356075 /DNA_START=862 /DNA_END=3276 /DNA_ORIENTATION=-
MKCATKKNPLLHLYVFDLQFQAVEQSSRFKSLRAKISSIKQMQTAQVDKQRENTELLSSGDLIPAIQDPDLYFKDQENVDMESADKILASIPTYLFLDTNAVLSMMDSTTGENAPVFTFQNLISKAKKQQFGECFSNSGDAVTLVITDTVMKELDGLKNKPGLRRKVVSLQSDTGFLAQCTELGFLEMLGAHQGENLIAMNSSTTLAVNDNKVMEPSLRNDRKIIDVALYWNSSIGVTGNVILLTNDQGSKMTSKRHNLPSESISTLNSNLQKIVKDNIFTVPWTAGFLKSCMPQCMKYCGREMHSSPVKSVFDIYREFSSSLDLASLLLHHLHVLYSSNVEKEKLIASLRSQLDESDDDSCIQEQFQKTQQLNDLQDTDIPTLIQKSTKKIHNWQTFLSNQSEHQSSNLRGFHSRDSVNLQKSLFQSERRKSVGKDKVLSEEDVNKSEEEKTAYKGGDRDVGKDAKHDCKEQQTHVKNNSQDSHELTNGRQHKIYLHSETTIDRDCDNEHTDDQVMTLQHSDHGRELNTDFTRDQHNDSKTETEENVSEVGEAGESGYREGVAEGTLFKAEGEEGVGVEDGDSTLKEEAKDGGDVSEFKFEEDDQKDGNNQKQQNVDTDTEPEDEGSQGTTIGCVELPHTGVGGETNEDENEPQEQHTDSTKTEREDHQQPNQECTNDCLEQCTDTQGKTNPDCKHNNQEQQAATNLQVESTNACPEKHTDEPTTDQEQRTENKTEKEDNQGAQNVCSNKGEHELSKNCYSEHKHNTEFNCTIQHQEQNNRTEREQQDENDNEELSLNGSPAG